MRLLAIPIVVLGLLACVSPLQAQTGSTKEISGVINVSTPVVSTSACAKIIVRSTLGFGVQDLILVIQMKGARIDTSNTDAFGSVLDPGFAGRFAFRRIIRIEPGAFVLNAPLSVGFDCTAAVQAVRVPEYDNVRITGRVLAARWNGETGGVIALRARGTVTMSADVDATGVGFRGGSASKNASFNDVTDFLIDPSTARAGLKGEGIASVFAASQAGRGAPANGGGGGGGHNSGGGGGSNAGGGGMGGRQHNGASSIDIGGRGGWALPGGLPRRLFAGGGGGGGHQNDNRGTAGAAGGGIVAIIADSLRADAGTAIRADGDSVWIVAGNDGAGGGGAGGTVVLDVRTFTGPAVTVSCSGGRGGDLDNSNNTSQCHGPGGGGGGGLLVARAGSPARFSFIGSGGRAGLNITYPSPCLNTSYGALSGTIGRTDFTLDSLIVRDVADTTGGAVKPVITASRSLTFCEGDSVVLMVTASS